MSETQVGIAALLTGFVNFGAFAIKTFLSRQGQVAINAQRKCADGTYEQILANEIKYFFHAV